MRFTKVFKRQQDISPPLNVRLFEEYVLECGFSGMPIQLRIFFKKTIEIPENE